jgi:hypothetical protein
MLNVEKDGGGTFAERWKNFLALSPSLTLPPL